MKKVMCLFVLALGVMFNSCSKDDDNLNDYPKDLMYSVYETNTLGVQGGEGKLKLSFRKIDIECSMTIRKPDGYITFISNSKPTYTYSKGNGAIRGVIDFGNGTVMMDGETGVIYSRGGETYIVANGNTVKVNYFPPKNIDMTFKIVDNKLIFDDDTEFIRK